ncbi:hypothetical protein ACHWQZ_G008776 [Mnemiopsis leidyi]
MSSDKHVGSFMLEKGVCDLLLAPLVRSSNFRVREVSLGIIANLMCHRATAKVVTQHDTLRTFVPTLLREDDVSVLTETVRLLRAALGLEIEIADRWRQVLPDDTVERLIHIIQSTLDMTSVRSSVLKEHCAMMLEIMFYHDDQLLANSAYTVFPLVDILLNRNSRPLEEPLLRCLQYLCEEKRAVTNMSQCPGLPKVLHRVISEKIEHSLTAVCLSLVCTLLTSEATDEMCAWLEKDCNITDTAIRTLHRIIQDDQEELESLQNTNSRIREGRDDSVQQVPDSENLTDARSSQDSPNQQETAGQAVETTQNGQEPSNLEELPPQEPPNDQDPPNGHRVEGTIETPTPKSADRLRVESSTPIRLVTPTYGTPCAVPTPTSQSNANTPQSTLSTPYSLQRRVAYTPSEPRVRRATSEPSRPILQVCREMAWNFLYTLANHIPTEGSCVLRYISDRIKELIFCFQSEGDKHVELAMLYKQHLEKYLHFSKSCSSLNKYITRHTLPGYGLKVSLNNSHNL